MTARTDAALKTQITTLLSNNTTGAISAADLRSVLDDIVDSKAQVAPAADHTRRAAISTDTTLAAAEVLAGESSTTRIVRTPTWGTGVFRYVFLGVAEDEDDITDIKQGGVSVLASWEEYLDNSNAQIIVESHKWWRTTQSQDGEFTSDIPYEIIQ